MDIQTVTFIIAVLSFIMSAITWILTGLSKSTRIDFDVLDYRTYDHSCKFYVRIVNKSSQPIIIYSISMIDSGHEQPCCLAPILVREAYGLKFYTAQFPINLAALQAGQFYIEYRNFPENEPTQLVENKTVAFRICSNRSPIKRCATLGKPDYYLHKWLPADHRRHKTGH